MNMNQWTRGLIAAGVVSFGAVAQAEEAPANQVLTAVSSTQISGYVSTTAQYDIGNAGAFGHGFQASKSDGFSLDVINLTISKPLDEGEWSAGYKAELWMGPDAATLGTGSTTAGAFAGAEDFQIKQAYVALNAPIGNGIVFKMGVFDTIIGYEASNGPDNPNYTRSYGWSIEPTTHTGILASYQLCEWATLVGGVAEAGAVINSPVSAVQSQKSYLAGISLKAPAGSGFLEGATLNAGVVDTGSAGLAPDVVNIYVGGTIPTPVANLSLGYSWDHIYSNGAADTDAYALYVAYGVSDKLTLSTRADYLDNNGGVFAPLAATPGGGLGAAGIAATRAELFGLTVTADYALWANVVTRLEYRWDHDVSGGRHLPGNVASGAAGTPGNNHQLIALNVVYKF